MKSIIRVVDQRKVNYYAKKVMNMKMDTQDQERVTILENTVTSIQNVETGGIL